MYSDAKSARADLVTYGRKIENRGLVVGPGGNTSARVGDVIYVKASGIAFEDAEADDYVGVSLHTGELVDGDRRATSEIAMHRLCYQVRKDIGAVVHTHPPLATGLATAGESIPPLYPDYVALLGDSIPLLDYIVPTGNELAEAVAEALRDHVAVMLANHGVVTIGKNVREAYYRNLIVESAAQTYLVMKQLGSRRALTPDEVAQIDSLAAEKYRRKLLEQS